MLLSFQGAVGAYWTLRILSTIGFVSEELELDVLVEAEFRAAFGSVPVPPKKDWYQLRSVLAPMAPATLFPPCRRA
jgi:hypothetical protein